MDFGRCNKMTAKFELKDDTQSLFKEKKRNVPFASLPQINEELDRLERTRVLSKIEYSQWASPTMWKGSQMRSRSAPTPRRGLMLHSKTVTILYQVRKKFSRNWMEENFFLKLILVTCIFKYQWRKNVLICSVSTLIVGCTSSDVFRSRSMWRQ